MTQRKAAFAIPGDINILTGGYIYERLLLQNLRQLGHDVDHVVLANAFPFPSESEMQSAAQTLQGISPDRALIIDGLVFGSIDTQALKKVRAPLVAMIHHPLAKETGLAEDAQDHLFKTERDNLALAQAVLVPSPHTADILISEYGVPGDRIHIAQPGIDQPVQPRVPVDPPLILSVGIQHARKGHDVLLRALAEIKSTPWRCVIAGSAHDADYAAQLVQMVAKFDLEGRVTLAGNVPRDALNALYIQSTVFALATRYEGYGMVFNEALTWGLPIVSCRAGAVPDTVPRGAGILVDVDDCCALSAALHRVLTEADTRGRMETASLTAGRALPTWRDTAQVASDVLNGLAL